jgi:hypothetical protein
MTGPLIYESLWKRRAAIRFQILILLTKFLHSYSGRESQPALAPKYVANAHDPIDMAHSYELHLLQTMSRQSKDQSEVLGNVL